MITVLGVILVVFGLMLIVLKVLIALGAIHPPAGAGLTLGPGGVGVWDLLMALLDKAGWLVVVGLILIFAGLLLLGVKLPFLS